MFVKGFEIHRGGSIEKCRDCLNDQRLIIPCRLTNLQSYLEVICLCHVSNTMCPRGASSRVNETSKHGFASQTENEWGCDDLVVIL